MQNRMRPKLLFSSVVLSHLLTLEAVGGAWRVPTPQQAYNDKVRVEQNMQMEEVSKKGDNEKKGAQDEFSQVSRYQIDFLGELQANRTLRIDVKKIQDRVEAAETKVDKDSEARSFLERYAAYIRSYEGCNANDIKKAVKEYAERNYTVLEEVLSDLGKIVF